MIKKQMFGVLIAVAFVVGLSLGGSVVYKWSQAQEAGRLKVALELKDRERQAALGALTFYYENIPPVAEIETEIKEVIDNVTNDPVCDVKLDERRMLNYSRTGVRDASSRIDGGPGSTEAVTSNRRLPRAVEVTAHADAGLKYQQCYAVAKAVHLYLTDRTKN